MTGKDLFDQMLAIGGKTQWVGHEGVARFEAVNRAVFEVNRLFPVTQKIQLVNYPLTPVAFHGGIREHKGGEVIRIDASGIKSLAFAVSGGGGRAVLYSVTVNEKEEESLEKIEGFEWEALTSFEVKRCVVPSSAAGGASPSPTDEGAPYTVTLVFSGDFNYLIKDVSMYGDIKSIDAKDVDVFSPWVKYDLKGIDYLGERFMAFDSTPVRFDNVSLNSPYDYKIEGSAVYLRADRPGVYEISVMLHPRRIQNESDEVDVNAQLEDLVALRAAYHLYSLTDTEIAETCNIEYQKLLSIALANVRKVRTQSQYRNTLKGW